MEPQRPSKGPGLCSLSQMGGGPHRVEQGDYKRKHEQDYTDRVKLVNGAFEVCESESS